MDAERNRFVELLPQFAPYAISDTIYVLNMMNVWASASETILKQQISFVNALVANSLKSPNLQVLCTAACTADECGFLGANNEELTAKLASLFDAFTQALQAGNEGTSTSPSELALPSGRSSIYGRGSSRHVRRHSSVNRYICKVWRVILRRNGDARKKFSE